MDYSTTYENIQFYSSQEKETHWLQRNHSSLPKYNRHPILSILKLWNSLDSNFDFLAISYDLFENNISESEFHHKINW